MKALSLKNVATRTKKASRAWMPAFEMIVFSFCLSVVFFLPQQGFAVDLMTVYREALVNDPTFQAADGTYFAAKEQEPQAFAALLPTIAATNEASTNKNQGDANQSITAGDQTYTQNVFTLTASQPVFNYQNWMILKGSKSSVKSAEATYNAAAQDLIIRVASAYFNVLQAKDNLIFTQSQKRSLERQMNQAEQRYKVGLDTITAVYQAQAAYDAMVAQEISNKNDLFIQFEQLRTLTNHAYDSLQPVNKKTLPLIKPVPADPNTWVKKALEQNYTLLSSKYAMDAARTNIKTQQGGHYPYLDLEGSYEDLDNDATANSASPTGQNTVVSLNLTFPLFQGGLISSQTRQAQYEYKTAAAQYQSSYLNTLVSTKTAYNTLIVSLSQITADNHAVSSAENSRTSTEAQFRVGTLTMVDVLTAQQQLYEAQTQQAKDQYTYLNAILLLKQSAGTLNVTDLQEINNWLDKNPQHAINNELFA